MMLARVAFLPFLFLSFACGEHVLNLKESDFDNTIKQYPLVLVKFFAPWCGHCKRLAPEYIKAAELLSQQSSPVALAEVDCTVESSLCSKYDVSGYPTLKIFMNGQFHSNYNGPREADGIANYMHSRAGPSSTECKTKDDIEKVLSEDKPTVITYIKSSSDAFVSDHMGLASELIDHVKFAHTHNDIMGTSQDLLVRMYLPKQLRSKFEEDYVDYKGQTKVEDVRQWIQNNGHGLCGYRTPGSEFFFPDSDLVVIYNNASLDTYASGVKYLRNRLLKLIKPLAKKSKNLKFAYSPSDPFSMEMSEYGFEYSAPFPAVRILGLDGKKYKLDGYTPETFTKFVEDFMSGSLSPYLKSEPVPAETKDGLKHIVALNFNEVVNDPKKDVMVVFHAPWCGHCKALMPKYEKAAEQLKDEAGVLLVAMNAVANDVPKAFEVTGFPTIYFVPKSQKTTPKPYHGGRETEDIVKYIAKEATDELVGFDRSGNRKKGEL